jgi:hypothetical protein
MALLKAVGAEPCVVSISVFVSSQFPLAGGAYNYISMSLVGVGCVRPNADVPAVAACTENGHDM